MSSRNTTLALLVMAMLAACALEPAPKPTDYRAEALGGVQPPGQWTAAGAAADPVAGSWVATFGDSQLDALVTEAIANNLDLKVAAARVQVAAEYVKLADSTLWPQVNLLARGGGKMGGDSSGLNGAGLYANWELDLWGRVRSARAAAEATYGSAVADAEFARQSVAALVAKAYFVAIEATLQLRLAQESVDTSQRLVAFAEQRQRIGKGDGYDTALARGNVETYRDTAEKLTLSRGQALRALEVLVGRYPAADIEVATQLVQPPASVPAGLPSELLERRPDVVAADRRVAAAFYGVQEAKAARLPSISLTASVSDISSDLFVLKNRDNPIWSAGASLLQPLFNAGALQTQVRIRTAEQKQSIAEYGQVGARAFAEVEDALSAEFAASRREAALTRAVDENQVALEFGQQRFKVGSSDLRAVSQQQLVVFGTQSALLRVQCERLVQRVNLYLALGGGFETVPASAPVARAKE
ncbi:MAG: TolC family protein [Proteobacteria bacterium]|nr:TolC family protein [Pseudomonadota bacterium]